jgi:Tol biopolymer transport system component
VWSPDGKYLAFPDRSSREEPPAIFLLSADTLKKRRLTAPPANVIGDWSPAFSPDGRRLAFVRWSSEGAADIYLTDVEHGATTRVTLENAFGLGLAWTPDGQEIVFSSPRSGRVGLWRVPISGGALQPVGVGGESSAPAWIVSAPTISGRTHRLAYAHAWYDTNVWSTRVSRSAGNTTPRLLIASTRTDTGAQFSPDGRRLVFMSDRSGVDEIWTCDTDGSNPVQLTAFGRSVTGTPRWAPDSRRVAFDARPYGQADIFVVDADGGAPRRLTRDPSNDVVPSWSRDGRWVYFASNRTGSRQVWKVPAEGGRAVQVTRRGGFAAFESLDGHEVYYARLHEPGLWKVPVDGGEEVLVIDRLQPGLWGYWAVTPEGLYFLDALTGSPPTFQSYDPALGQYRRLATMEKEPCRWGPGLGVSPDGGTLLYCQVDQIGSDLMLIENFR